jgi:branched-chain amino acid transport system permease protein
MGLKDKSVKQYLLWAGVFIVSLTIPLFLKNPYLLHILVLSGIYSILAIGLNILTGFCGQINLGIAGLYAIGAYTGALVNLHYGLSFWWAVAISVIFTGIVGLLIGFPALKVKGGVYLVLVTIGFAEIVKVILFQWSDLTRGPMGLVGITPPQFGKFVFALPEHWYYLTLIFLGLTMFTAERIVHSRIGRSFIAIRESDQAAQSMGINLTYYKMLAMGITGICAGLAGALYSFYMTTISPDIFNFNLSVQILMIIVVGGMANIKGSIVGALVMTVLPEWLRGFGQFQMILYALGVMLFIIFLPNGIFGMGLNLKEFLQRIFQSSQGERGGAK